jgi:hypothetical protein
MGMQRGGGGEFLGQWDADVYILTGRRWTTDERDQPVARTGDLDVRAATSLQIDIKVKGEAGLTNSAHFVEIRRIRSGPNSNIAEFTVYKFKK